MCQGRPRVRGSLGALAVLVAVSACGSKPAALPVRAPDAVKAAPPPVCGPPRQILVAQKADDGESSRLIVVAPDGTVLWQGPQGSGENPGAWSPDGALLAYAVGEDLIVHRDRGPDKLVFRGLALGDGDPLFSFSRDGRWLAARGPGSVRVVDAAESRNLEPVSVDTGIACSPSGLYWTRGSDRLVVACDAGELHVWDPATHADQKREIDAAYVLGWWPAAADTLLVQRDDDSLWLQPLVGAATHLSGGPIRDGGELSIDSFVPRSGVVVLTDYEDAEGYARTLWLAAGGGAPPIPWLDGSVMGLAYSSDGAWAAFTTAPSDGADEAGDLYVARVGESRVRLVAAAPTYDDGDQGEGDDDAEPEDVAGDQAYYLGYAFPKPRPDPTSVCKPARVAAREQLEVEHRYSVEKDQAFVTSGGAVHVVAGGRIRLISGERTLDVGDASLMAVQDARPLDAGGWLISDPSTTYWRGDDGRELARMPRIDIERTVALPGGRLAYLAASDMVEVRDADGKVAGSYRAPTLIDALLPNAGGLAVQLTGGGVDLLDASAHKIGALDPGDATPLASLPDGLVGVAPDYGEDDEVEAPPLIMTFYDRAGKARKTARLATPDGDTTVLELFSLGDEAVAIVGEERPRAHFVASSGRERGVFTLGLAPEAGSITLDDDVAVIPVAGRHLYLVDKDGRYLGGRELPQPIVHGPVVLGRERFAIDTGEEVLVLRRKRP